jgi:hypothetical protein
MDRRDALKKLGAGGLTVAGASMIVSTPAFAYDLPTGGMPAMMAVASTGNTATVMITSNGTASCPNSAPSQTATVVSVSTRVVTVNAVPVFFIFFNIPTEFRLGGVALPQTTGAASFAIQKFGQFIVGATNFVNGDVFRAEITVTWRCTYSDGTTRDRPITTNLTATRAGGLWSIT